MNYDPHTPLETSPTWRDWFSDNFRVWPMVLGAALAVLFLWLAFRDVPLVEVRDALRGLGWGWVGLALALSTLGTLARGARWRLLYYPDHQAQDVVHLAGVLFISQGLNVLVPMRVGELARLYLVREARAARTLGSIAVEKLLDMLTLLAFLLVLPLLVGLPGWFKDSSQGFTLLALGLFGLTLLLFFIRKRLLGWLSVFLRFLPSRWHTRLQSMLDQALQGLDVFASPTIGVRLQGWSFLIWGMGAVVNGILMRAMELSLPMAAPLFLLLVLQVGISVPSTPGKLGVFQYLVILALAAFNVEKGVALSYSLLLYLVAFTPHLVFGALFGVLALRKLSFQTEDGGRKTEDLSR
jgi:glycosyltransferase 2 family protein